MHVRRACMCAWFVCVVVRHLFVVVASTYVRTNTHTGRNSYTHLPNPPRVRITLLVAHVLLICAYFSLSHTSPLCQECELCFRQLETTPVHPHRSVLELSSNYALPQDTQHTTFFRTCRSEQLCRNGTVTANRASTSDAQTSEVELGHLHSMIKAVGGQNPFLDKCKMHMQKNDTCLSTW